MISRARHIRAIILGVTMMAYALGYLCTTRISLGGTGGLTGPVRVRVFTTEQHLLVFYPLYLIERWCRNLSLTDAAYHFNVDFEDEKRERLWLYGDGKYSRIWYSF